MRSQPGSSAAGRPAVRLTAARLAAVLAAAVVLVLTGCGARAEGPTAEVQRPELIGDFFTHDPALVKGEDGEPWFIYSTGSGCQ